MRKRPKYAVRSLMTLGIFFSIIMVPAIIFTGIRIESFLCAYVLINLWINIIAYLRPEKISKFLLRHVVRNAPVTMFILGAIAIILLINIIIRRDFTSIAFSALLIVTIIWLTISRISQQEDRLSAESSTPSHSEGASTESKSESIGANSEGCAEILRHEGRLPERNGCHSPLEQTSTESQDEDTDPDDDMFAEGLRVVDRKEVNLVLSIYAIVLLLIFIFGLIFKLV